MSRLISSVMAGRLWLASYVLTAWLAGCGGKPADMPAAAVAATAAVAENAPSAAGSDSRTRSKGGWLLTDLGTLGGTFSQASGINSLGQVVGMSLVSGDSTMHAFLYRNGGMLDIGTLGGSFSWGSAINDGGQVVGISQTGGNSASHAFLYSNGSMADLGTLGGDNSGALAINNAGQVVGSSQMTDDSASHAFLYKNGSMNILGNLGIPGQYSNAAAINQVEEIAGQAPAAKGGFSHAFLYSGGNISDLGTLSGPDGPTSFAQGINDLGQVAGTSYFSGGNPSDEPHAFLYDRSSGMVDLGTLSGPGGFYSSAYAVNNAGQVVGTSAFGSERNAFLYQEGKMTNLNQLQVVSGSGWVLEIAAATNDAGQIAGSGQINGETHAFLLTPLDPPSQMLR